MTVTRTLTLTRNKRVPICLHDPRETTGPIGMYHCLECGERVVAAMEHPDYSLLEGVNNETNTDDSSSENRQGT